ncbi:50S ribosomal protein L1 [ANME-1 cluster archaeon ex4572_4]|nr:50S ribosomal protein L1 [Methanophagales archaeon]OYT66933.1 MAG: 50S ribosomal protein L1 [ANME-1 cluster archaeon ex4572_4]PXF51831.1 MAG: 50S ribosomal protein L1 [Methanophagales archaeon]HDN68904.1 50S ribosomal protein L1 [Methanomicrobia archaeon]
MEAEEIVGAVEEAVGSRERGFVETVDLCINLKNLDLKQPKNRISVDVVLPKKFRELKIGAFASGEVALKAKEAGAEVLDPEELKRMDKKKARELVNKYDYFVAEASLMALVGRSLGTILGPRGKMPEAIPPGADPAQILSRLQRIARVKSKTAVLWVSVGRKNMAAGEIAENAAAVLKAVESRLERGWQNIGSVFMKTTMGRAVKVV